MAKNNNLTDFVTDLANHIRGKVGLPTTSKINPQNFSDYIDKMPHLVDISEQYPAIAVNMAKGDPAKVIEIPTDFPWKTLPDGSNFISVVVFHGVLTFQFSEVISDPTRLGTMYIADPHGNTMAMLEIYGHDTNVHTVSYWWAVVVQDPAEAIPDYAAGINYPEDDPGMDKCSASIVVTPYIVKIGDRVLSLQTCKGEA